MNIYVAHFAAHGLKMLSASSGYKALEVFTNNNRGQPPEWCTRIAHDEYRTAKQLAALGWRGDMEQFYSMMPQKVG